jgi:hypothetical protein
VAAASRQDLAFHLRHELAVFPLVLGRLLIIVLVVLRGVHREERHVAVYLLLVYDPVVLAVLELTGQQEEHLVLHGQKVVTLFVVLASTAQNAISRHAPV